MEGTTAPTLAAVERRYRSSFERAAVGLAHVGLDGRWLCANRRYCDILGYEESELRGLTVRDLTDPDDRRSSLLLFEQIRSGAIDRYTEEKRYRRKDGSAVWVLVTASLVPGKGGERPFLVTSVTDLTEQVGARRALEEARAAAERANDAKTRFLAAASHDLRQPIQALRLLLHLLSDKAVSADQSRICARMNEALGSTESMVARLMEFAALELGGVPVSLQPVPLHDLLARIGHEMSDEAARKGLILRVHSAPCLTESDPMLLERMIRNLVANAVRYTERGGILLAVRRRGGALHIEVRDSGCGIPEDKQHDIFEEFRQLANPERDRTKGMGLGLAIVARTAELLGHAVGLRSRPGAGSVFSIAVPLLAEAGRRVPDWVSPVAVAGNATVLLVEDDVVQLAALETILADAGFTVMPAREAIGALDLLRDQARPPDIILSDYRLPGGVSGIDLIKAVREKFGRRVPAIIVTGDTQASIVEMAAAADCPILHKPYTLPELIATLNGRLRPRD